MRSTPAPVGLGLDSVAVRMRMVQRLAASGIQSPSVLGALGRVERHLFVDSALVNQAYEDTSLPIGLQQTISKPSVVARMIELLEGAECARASGKLGRVLEVGTGCGYQAAVLACVAQQVYSVERLRGLHEKARNKFAPSATHQCASFVWGRDVGLRARWSLCGHHFGRGGESVPRAWLDQLAVGGRLVAPTVRSTGQQALLVVDKTPHGFTESVLEAVHFVPLKSGIA